MQRFFVAEFLASQEEWGEVTGTKIPRGKELDWYLSSGAVIWHMQHAWSKPLVKDEQACSWLRHTNEQIVATAVSAIPLDAQTELAEILAESGALERAVQALCNVTMKSKMPLARILKHTKRVFTFIDRIPIEERSPECTNYEVAVAMYVLIRGWGVGDSDIVFERVEALVDRGAAMSRSSM